MQSGVVRGWGLGVRIDTPCSVSADVGSGHPGSATHASGRFDIALMYNYLKRFR